MMRGVRGIAAYGLFLLASLPAGALAQQAVTVTGYVRANGVAIRGASVRIDQLEVGTTTNDAGRYSFIIPSSKVRGQTVALTVRYTRYPTRTVEIALTGGAVEQDFDLGARDDGQPARQDPARQDPARPPVTTRDAPRDAPATTRPGTPRTTTAVPSSAASVTEPRSAIIALAPLVDSSAFADVAGPTSLADALAGRFAGLEVHSASTLGGTSGLLVRGAHSVSGTTQPLVVVNGLLFDDSDISTASQRAGQGGFDYGSGINDLNLEDIAHVQLLRGPMAAMRYGGRAANGVLLVSTKSGRGLNGFAVSASQQYASAKPLRLPTFQDRYGQGLGGQFAFFDGKGGGVNDAVDQSWGPALDGQPVTQASVNEASRPDVRPWFPQPHNVRDYFAHGSTLATNVSFQGGNTERQMRASLSNIASSGPTPESSISRRTAFVTAGIQPNSRLALGADLGIINANGEDRSGTGFDESNPASVFAHMGRQVDFAIYDARQRDNNLAQLSWNYAGHNNPYFASKENDNHDSHTRVIGGAVANYGLTSTLTATARVGVDRATAQRSFTVAGGWMGGFPYYAGRGDFSTGGFEVDDVTNNGLNGELVLRTTPVAMGGGSVVFSGGVGRRSNSLDIVSRGADKLVDTTTSAPVSWSRSTSTNAIFGGLDASLSNRTSVSATLRQESASIGSGSSGSTFYPAVLASIDVAPRDSSGRTSRSLESVVLRAGWSRSGNDATASALQRFGVTGASSAAAAGLASPEVTSGWEVGVNARMFDSRLLLDLSAYGDRTSDVVLATAGGIAPTSTELSNKGIEATANLVPIRLPNGMAWSVGATFGKNINLVEGGSPVILVPSFRGVSLEARPGSAVGAIVGLGYLRDASGQLLLRNGRPLADSAAGRRVLGTPGPAWTAGVSSSLQYRWLEFSVLVDTHHGGSVFSATNMVGATSGVLGETAFRPDSGLLIAGVDIATQTPNTTHVSTEDYYHALGAIGERWVYDASFVKLREAKVSFTIPLKFITVLNPQSLRGAIIARNAAIWTKAPNIDPETALSASPARAEMGQLPATKSIGFQITLTP
jgi:hypothetical protein